MKRNTLNGLENRVYCYIVTQSREFQTLLSSKNWHLSHLSPTVFGILGLALLLCASAQIAFAQDPGYSNLDNYNPERIVEAVDALFCLIEGSLGALIMVIAGLIAIISAAMGSYRAAVSMLVVAIGSFILRALVSMFFGSFETDISGCGGI